LNVHSLLKERCMTVISLPSLAPLIDHLEEGVLFLDQHRNVLAINQAALTMLGHEPAGVVGMLCPSLFQGTRCARACELRGNCALAPAEPGQKRTQDIALERPDGSLVSIRMWALALPEGESQARFVVMLRDCTREKELEQVASERLRLGGLLGRSPAMQGLFRTILRVASSEATILISGESGTGKELVARALHENSSRSDGPYLRVHCAALAENILESELFGHAKGAFTGATTARAGRFEAADGGTILLDEIGEISSAIQVKLLRVLQEREVERLGENQPRKVDVRIIAATHRDLAAMVKMGTFREDLYYRLRVLPIHVPPLREREGDIALLAQQILGQLVQRYRRDDMTISQETLKLIEAYPWPGNVRELVNAMEYALVNADGSTILPRHLPPELLAATPPAVAAAEPLTRYYHTPREAADEREAVAAALREAGGNKARAAELLGMSRTTLWKRLKTYNLDS
jgi:PAS domain S-box-containing protein